MTPLLCGRAVNSLNMSILNIVCPALGLVHTESTVVGCPNATQRCSSIPPAFLMQDATSSECGYYCGFADPVAFFPGWAAHEGDHLRYVFDKILSRENGCVQGWLLAQKVLKVPLRPDIAGSTFDGSGYSIKVCN